MRRRRTPLDRLHHTLRTAPLQDPAAYFNGWGLDMTESMIWMCERLGRYDDAARLRADFERARDEWLAES